MELAKNLITLTKLKGLSISSLAKLSGVKQPTLHGWTTGRSVKNIKDLKKVCAILEVSLHSLLFGEEDPYKKNYPSIKELFKGEARITIELIEKD